MSEKNHGGVIARFRGLGRENFGEERKKMTRAMPGHHFNNCDINCFDRPIIVMAVFSRYKNDIKIKKNKAKLNGTTIFLQLSSQFNRHHN